MRCSLHRRRRHSIARLRQKLVEDLFTAVLVLLGRQGQHHGPEVGWACHQTAIENGGRGDQPLGADDSSVRQIDAVPSKQPHRLGKVGANSGQVDAIHEGRGHIQGPARVGVPHWRRWT